MTSAGDSPAFSTKTAAVIQNVVDPFISFLLTSVSRPTPAPTAGRLDAQKIARARQKVRLRRNTLPLARAQQRVAARRSRATTGKPSAS